MLSDLENEYYHWLYGLVCNKYASGPTFHKLIKYLHEVEFVPMMKFDKNIAEHGIEFRYRFGYERGYSTETTKAFLDENLGPCRMLEMMVSLAFRIEEHIMYDPDFGNRTGQWFWNMIVSLGLGSMDDESFVVRYVDDVIYRFINRDYQSNGHGGLFTLKNPNQDMRFVEIYTQAMWYLDENFEFTI